MGAAIFDGARRRFPPQLKSLQVRESLKKWGPIDDVSTAGCAATNNRHQTVPLI
jgi:hypothetical protein